MVFILLLHEGELVFYHSKHFNVLFPFRSSRKLDIAEKNEAIEKNTWANYCASNDVMALSKEVGGEPEN